MLHNLYSQCRTNRHFFLCDLFLPLKLFTQEKLLEEDFDEAKHDQAMSEMFGEDYYAVDDGNEKPVFDDEDIDVIRKLLGVIINFCCNI